MDGRLHIVRLAACLAALLAAQELLAAEEPATPLAEVLQDRDAKFVPDRLGETFTVAGILTTDPLPLNIHGRAYATMAYMADPTGAIALYASDPTILRRRFRRGDRVRVRGTLSQHNGTEELIILDIQRLGAGMIPQPREVLAADIKGERYSGQLVRVIGDLLVPPDFRQTHQGLQLRDRSDTITVAISEPWFANPDFLERLQRGGAATLVGIAGQYDIEPPFNSGYRLIPRDADDFGFAPVIPYRLVTTSLTIFALLCVLLYLWLRRRAAKRHAWELSLLTGNLKQSEEALRQSEEWFRKVFEDSPVGIIITGAESTILQANRAFCQILGYAEHELVGLKFVEVMHPDDRSPTEEPGHGLLERAMRGYQTEKRFITRSRKVIWAKLTASAVPDRTGKPLYTLSVVEDITQRKSAEEVLAKSERRFRALIEKSSDSITMLGPDGKLLYDAGAPTLRNLGYPEPEVVGRMMSDFLHPEDIEPIRRLLSELVDRPGTAIAAQYRLRHQSGTHRWIEGTGTNLLSDPSVGAIVINSRDISDRKQAEEKLRQSEERFSKAFHASPVAISIATLAEGRFIDANESFLRLTGYRREELVTRTALELGIWVDPADRDEVAQRLRREGSIRDVEGRFCTKSGERRESLAALELIELDGELCILCLLHDITERKSADAALRKSEERFQLIARATNDTVWDWDLKTDQVWWNEGIKTLFGYSIEEAGYDGSWWDEHIHPDDKEAVLSGMRAVIIGGDHFWSAEYRYRRANGSYADVFDRGYVLRDDQGNPVRMIGAMMDITDRKRVERELAKARDEAVESARLKSEFLANISHEVRTPLNGIIGMTVLLRDTRLNAQQRGFADTIQSSADALLTIINDILDFSKIEAGKMHFESLDFDLRKTVESTIELLAERAQRKHIELISLINHDAPALLRGDPGRLRQVLTNMVDNAIKFTERGEVLVRVSRDAETDSHATLCFTITDTGIGIREETLPNLFHAFYQADGSTTRRYGGTGLGLAISKQLVEMMGGQIGVESVLGKGSTFWFTVKLEKQVKDKGTIPIPTEKLAGLRILVLDENNVSREALLGQARALMMRPESASAADETIRMMREAVARNDPFRIAILDTQSSGVHPIDLARTIKADPLISSTRLLLLIAPGSASDTAILRAAGFGAFLNKPWEPTSLIERLAGLASASAQHETRFWLNRKETGVAAPDSKHPAAQRPLHILVAEDNAINQRVAIGLLEKLGYRAEAVANGKEVLKAVELVQYDIILMDCQLPELDGYKATMEIRRREGAGNGEVKRVYIIAMTAHAVPGAREKCLAAGMDDYISKPVYLDTLETILRKAVDQVQNPSDPTGLQPPRDRSLTLDTEMIQMLRDLRRPGRPDPVGELVELFLHETPDRLRELRSSAVQYDAVAMETLAHRLRGCASSVGANRMAELCGEVEEHARTGAIQTASRLLVPLESEFDRVRTALDLEKSL
ncbi:MAG TPA: PAS domain S-box protein [Candidatus Nitrosotalea sp.]|nr:PAS domain S-box protein [Candidatus Nitrosotalea sp.]